MLMRAISYGGCTDTERESALKVDPGKKTHCRIRESNPSQLRDGPMLYQLSHIPFLAFAFEETMVATRRDFRGEY